MAKITVLGAGGWGMALALSAYGCGNEVTIWSPFPDEVAALQNNRGNERLLSGIRLPDEIGITSDLSSVKGSAITIIATPSIAVRQTAKKLSAEKDFGIVVNVAKGFEKGSLMRLSQVIAEELPSAKIAVLSGPSHAEEVARGIPTSVVAASDSAITAQIVQSIMSGDNLRIYTSDDLIGVELGGALKNVIAIASGFCDGLGLGDNSKAALITRGLAEMARLGVCMGAKEYTFSGLTGIGDLVVTCTSQHSRNHRFGVKVGSGTPIKQALEEVGTVEGYYAADLAHSLAKKYNIEMPITEECYAILYENKDVKDVPNDLMRRPKRSEH
ncbi:MAG: NAD(P)H-dependent glycerol-3-phosphate dehydrogenase [Acutalibacteraceae bacterium]